MQHNYKADRIRLENLLDERNGIMSRDGYAIYVEGSDAPVAYVEDKPQLLAALKDSYEFLGWIAELHNTDVIDLHKYHKQQDSYAILASIQNNNQNILYKSER